MINKKCEMCGRNNMNRVIHETYNTYTCLSCGAIFHTARKNAKKRINRSNYSS